METASPLAVVTSRAGAVMTRGGANVAVHYGSAAAELGVCVAAVGLADRSDLGKLAITGPADGIADLLRDIVGAPLEPAGVAVAAAAWWCAASPEHVIVQCERARAPRLLRMLRAQARRLPGVEVADVSASLSAIALVGPRAPRLLSALGALGPGGDPRSAAPFGCATIGGAAVRVLLQTDRRALVLVEALVADRVWRAIAETGRPFGLSCVGTEAVERFALIDRLRVPSAPSR
jgi:glycine cleavage system aminomethyltransferase T